MLTLKEIEENLHLQLKEIEALKELNEQLDWANNPENSYYSTMNLNPISRENDVTDIEKETKKHESILITLRDEAKKIKL